MSTDPFLPPEARREILRDYGARHGLRVFVETGTNDGGTPWALKDDFDKLYTIEIGRDLFQAALARFADCPQVICLHGDSGVLLPAVLEEIGATPALCWLDGHRCTTNPDEGGEQDTPVLDELAAIFATGVPHVVLVDDARLFDGMPWHHEQENWPHIETVKRLAEGESYRYDLADDIIRLEPT